MDLRGSSSTFVSGLRVSAIPPAPISGPSLKRTVLREKAGAGAKAEALATRAAMMASLYC